MNRGSQNVNTPGQMWRYLGFVFALACPGLLLKPNFVRGGPSKTSSIELNLKQIAGAKEQWAIEHHETGAVLLAPSD